MTTHGSLVEKNYIAIREGVEFFYFGNGCIADYYTSTIGYLDEIDIAIINCCNGTATLMGIIEKLKQIDSNIVKEKIYSLRKKGIIVFKPQQLIMEPIFLGEKGYYYPKAIAIELLNKCNYFCPFCYKNATVEGQLISDETILEIHNIIKNKVHNILLTGGEPTLHPNYLKYIDIFSEYAKVNIITNGSLLYLHDAKILKKLDHIQFSIYGCDDEEYKRMTGSATGFSDLCKSIEFSKKNGITTVASVTLCDTTIDHMEEFFKIAADFGVEVFRVGVADNFGRAEQAYTNGIYEAKLDNALNELIALKRKYSKNFKIDFPNIKTEHFNEHTDLKKFVYKDTFDCGCGSEYLVVSQAGKIRPCQMLSEEIFSYNNKLEALKEHINGNFHVQELFDSVNKFCNSKFKDKELPCHALNSYLKNKIK